MGQKFLDQGTDQEYLSATGGFSKTYMMETDPDGTDELRPLVAPVKPNMMVS